MVFDGLRWTAQGGGGRWVLDVSGGEILPNPQGMTSPTN